jgi:Phage tail protein.
MIKSVKVINYLDDILVLELARPDLSGFEVRDIQGLGPVKATINTSKVSTRDGVVYNSSTLDGRNIVLQLGFLNAPTVEAVRLRSYQHFPLKTEVEIVIETDTRLVRTYGRVESNEPTIFGKDSSAQISIVCPDAYFYDAGPEGEITTSFYGTTGGFEFPFSNESLTVKLLEFGEIEGIYDQYINYRGDSEVGITIQVRVTGPVGNLTIYKPELNEGITIYSDILTTMTGEGLNSGDVLTIKTSVGGKSATLLRGGVYINVLNALGRNVDWLTLTKGNNKFAYVATSGQSNVQIEIESLVIYEGV